MLRQDFTGFQSSHYESLSCLYGNNTAGNRQIAMIDSAISRSGTAYSVLRFGVGYNLGNASIELLMGLS